MEKLLGFVGRMFMFFVLIGVWQATGIPVFGWLALVNFALMVLWGIGDEL